MARRKIIHRPFRRPRVGDLRTRITLQDRVIVAPDAGEVDFDLDFSTSAVVWASIETFSGQTVFDGVSQDETITHRIIIRWIEGIGSETWILLGDGSRLNILDAENFEQRNEFLRFLAQRTGDVSDKVAEA